MLLSLVEHFGTVEDPRLERNKRHKLLDIGYNCVIDMCSGKRSGGLGSDRGIWK